MFFWLKVFLVIVFIVAIIILVRSGKFQEEIENRQDERNRQNGRKRRIQKQRDIQINDDESDEGEFKENDEVDDSDDVGDSDDVEESDEVDQSEPYESFPESGVRRSKPEQMCKKILQRIFRKKFIRVRPKWLRNPETGVPLELDCYNEELGIALEYNGIQHYKWPNFTGQTREQFEAQVRRDLFKRKKCEDLGIKLIVIRYDVPITQLEEKIVEQLYDY